MSSDALDIIEIHSSQISDFLRQRQKIPQNWLAQILKIEENYPKLIESLPPSVPQQYKQSPYYRYSLLKSLFSHLISPEFLEENSSWALTKNWLGKFHHPILQQISEILKSYESNSLYLAELGYFLKQRVEEEIPLLKRSIQEKKHQKGEFQKKLLESNNQIKRNHEKMVEIYEKYHIPLHCGTIEEISKEMEKSSQEILVLLENLMNFTQNPLMARALGFYDRFHAYSEEIRRKYHDKLYGMRKNISSSPEALGRPGKSLEILRKIHYFPLKQWKEKNLKQQDNEISSDISNSFVLSGSGDSIELDWVETEKPSEEEIMGEFHIEATGSMGESETSGNNEAAGANGKVDSMFSSKEFPLMDSSIRSSFINDLMELQSFYQVRLEEFSKPPNAQQTALFSAQFDVPSALASPSSASSDTVNASSSTSLSGQEFLLLHGGSLTALFEQFHHLTAILSHYSSHDLQQYLQYTFSSSYRKRFLRNLLLSKQLWEKSRKNSSQYEEKLVEIENSIDMDREKWKQEIQWIQEMKSEVLIGIEKLFPPTAGASAAAAGSSAPNSSTSPSGRIVLYGPVNQIE